MIRAEGTVRGGRLQALLPAGKWTVLQRVGMFLFTANFKGLPECLHRSKELNRL